MSGMDRKSMPAFNLTCSPVNSFKQGIDCILVQNCCQYEQIRLTRAKKLRAASSFRNLEFDLILFGALSMNCRKATSQSCVSEGHTSNSVPEEKVNEMLGKDLRSLQLRVSRLRFV
jgi:hypothetical protein